MFYTLANTHHWRGATVSPPYLVCVHYFGSPIQDLEHCNGVLVRTGVPHELRGTAQCHPLGRHGDQCSFTALMATPCFYLHGEQLAIDILYVTPLDIEVECANLKRRE